ncbi:unnamed protein product [Rhizoctonia solani]|uniref:Uncharacterized protein n=3 Tax=Rhizoctonia solani TaxID=456999 RepID=A0A8H3D2H5_9AGAM|nr:hypothetical protein RSOL_392670 [Rhizoctonia solani AG-3 Rhs1AP]KEP52506.1 hypothetical protein V565_044470 [Rhizoctonia solani 123E]CAE6499293.1 unnamed protein product [Rhizoctonia solani]CAE6507284.1 unnamed protein product [Rhizoctonia solani]
MAAAEALMELVPSGHSKRSGSQANGSALDYEDENLKERAMAATYSAYTKRTKMHAEKAKAQQLSRQLKTRLQFARLKVDYGWTRQSLNEVENLYFHLSRAKPVPQPPALRADKQDDQSTPSAVAAPPVQVPPETPTELSEDPSTQSTQEEIPLSMSHTSSLPGPSTSPVSLLFRASSLPQPTPALVPKRSEFVERTRTGGIVRSAQPPERLRTGGKVKLANGVLSPKKRGRPRIPDESDSAPTSGVSISSAGGAEGNLTYDSFWSSLGSLKTPSGS